jgi:hypothetical protein
MKVKTISIIITLILTFFLIPLNLFILKSIYYINLTNNFHDNNLKNDLKIIIHPYIEIEIKNSAKNKYAYYSNHFIKVEEVFLEVVLRNFSKNFHIEKQNESLRHYFKKLKNPVAVEVLKKLKISTIKRDFIDTLNRYTKQNYIKGEIEIIRSKINFLKEELKNENLPDLKKGINDEILLLLNKIHQHKNISKYKFVALDNEINIWLYFPENEKKIYNLKKLRSMYLNYLNNISRQEAIEIRINNVISIIILNLIYILVSILIIKNLKLMIDLNFFIFKKKNYKKIKK